MHTPALGSLPLEIDGFLARVEALAPSAWLAIGDGGPVDDTVLAAALLGWDTVTSDGPADVDGVFVRDALGTLAWLAERRLAPLRRADRARLTAARERLERAALTQLAAGGAQSVPVRRVGIAPTTRRLGRPSSGASARSEPASNSSS